MLYIEKVLTVGVLVFLGSACRYDIALDHGDGGVGSDAVSQQPGAHINVPPPNELDALDTALDTAGGAEDVPAEDRINCHIAEPFDGLVFEAGASIDFNGVAQSIGGGDFVMMWSSDTYGTMAVGEVFEFILPVGAHEIEMKVWDDGGAVCVDYVNIVVGE